MVCFTDAASDSQRANLGGAVITLEEIGTMSRDEYDTRRTEKRLESWLDEIERDDPNEYSAEERLRLREQARNNIRANIYPRLFA